MMRWLAAAFALAAVAAGMPGTPVEAGALPSGYARIAFAGDTHGFGIHNNPEYDNTDLLGGVRTVLGKADIFVANLEGTLIDPHDAAGHCLLFRNQSTLHTTPDFLGRIDAGVPMVAALGNNHAMDCGERGLEETLAALDAAGVSHVGAGMTLEEACAPLLMDANGVELAFVSYLEQDPATLIPSTPATETTPGVGTMAACGAEKTIDALAEERMVIVMLHAHWGSSWVYGTSDEHDAIVASLLSAGADLVVSSGPHLPQGVMTSGPEGTLGLMGVGNFMFRPFVLPASARESTLPLIEIERGAIARAWLYPIALSPDGVPSLVNDDGADAIVSIVATLSAAYESALRQLRGLGLAFPSDGAP